MISWISSHPLLSLLIGAAAVTFVWLFIKRSRLSIKWYMAALLAVLNVAFGVLCVKLFAVVEAGFDFSKFSGQSLFGSVFLLPLFYMLGAKLFKRRFADVFDCFTVPTVFTLFCARISCIITGCCLGAEIPGTDCRFPTREAELIFYAVLLSFLIPMVLRDRRRGEAFPIFMLAYGAFRFVCEFFRESSAFSGPFHLSHLWAVISLILGLSILIQIKQKANKSRNIKAK